MNDPTTYRTVHRDCCNEPMNESSLRNNYFEGKRLSVDSFRVEQRYTLERRRLLNRAIHGWGVVYGYEVNRLSLGSQLSGRLKVGDGLALDKCGRELLQTETRLDVDDMIFLNERGTRIEASKAFSETSLDDRMCWLLSVHYAERYAGSVTVENPCRCDYHEWDHTCETVRFSLQRIAIDACCSDDECELQCDCGTGPCCDGSTDGNNAELDITHKRGGCRCICEHLTQLTPGTPSGALCEIEGPCERVRVDVRNGVPLACVQLVLDGGRWVFGKEIEACGPRRLVKRNDLLYDLIRGCDLTRISEIGWKDWHRSEYPVPFDEFSDGLGPDCDQQPVYVANKFWLRFSRPVRRNTLRPDCFAMLFICSEREGGWLQTYRVPIVNVDTTGFTQEPGDPEDHVRGVRFVFDGAWVEDAVRGRKSLFLGVETSFELEIRGDFIIDCNGQAVDANASGLFQIPRGNGVPGGTLLSTFRVAPAPTHSDPYNTSRTSRGVKS